MRHSNFCMTVNILWNITCSPSQTKSMEAVTLKRIAAFAFLILLVSSQNPSRVFAEDGYIRTMKQDLLCLMMAYPGYITGFERKEDSFVYLIMKSGEKIIYDDRKVKNAVQRLDNADIQDTLQDSYPLGPRTSLMEENKDPGRYRCYKLLKEIYGKHKEDIEKKLKSTGFVYGRFLFNSGNNASVALGKTGQMLMPLMKDVRISKAVHPGSGTYNYRVIAGTGHLSPHAYGIAIDLARDSRDYWQWASREDGENRIKDYPPEVVKAFEDNGFIWGGKWWHFDILHFEYRPEIIFKAKYFSAPTGGEWYEASPMELSGVKEYIESINKALE